MTVDKLPDDGKVFPKILPSASSLADPSQRNNKVVIRRCPNACAQKAVSHHQDTAAHI